MEELIVSSQAGPAAVGEIAASLQTFAARHPVHSLLAAEALALAPAGYRAPRAGSPA